MKSDLKRIHRGPKRSTFLLAALVLTLASPQTRAQCVECAIQMNQAWLSSVVIRGQQEMALRSWADSNRGSGSNADRKDSPSSRLRTVAIANNAGVSDEVKRRYLENIRQTAGAPLAQRIEQYLQRTSIRSDFAAMVGPYQLNPNEYGDVFTAYMIGMWMVANNKRPPSANEIKAVRKQVDQLMAQGLPKGTPGDIQMQAEAMMYETVTAVGTREAMLKVNNRDGIKQLAATTQRNFLQANRISLQDVSISMSGLRPY